MAALAERLALPGRALSLLLVACMGALVALDAVNRTLRFPAVELIHGYLGRPQDWVDVDGVNAITFLDRERRASRMPPVIAVLPTASLGPSTECVDAANGERDETYRRVLRREPRPAPP